MSCVTGIIARHEPTPRFSDVMRQVQQDKEIAYEFWLNQKLPQIAQLKANIYLEASHMFCEGFLEPLLDMGIVPNVIFLSRPYRQVALSLYQLGSIPGRTRRGLTYLLSPGDPGVLLLPGWETLNDYQLCFWYCLEIDRRSKQYEVLLQEKGSQTARTSIAELNTLSGFHRLLGDLDIKKPTLRGYIRYMRFGRVQFNVKKEEKLNKPIPDHITGLEEEVIARCYPIR